MISSSATRRGRVTFFSVYLPVLTDRAAEVVDTRSRGASLVIVNPNNFWANSIGHVRRCSLNPGDHRYRFTPGLAILVEGLNEGRNDFRRLTPSPDCRVSSIWAVWILALDRRPS